MAELRQNLNLVKRIDDRDFRPTPGEGANVRQL